MVRTQVYLPEKMYENLKQAAKEQGITMAIQIREALDLYIQQKRQPSQETILSETDPIWNLIGIGESGLSDGSVHHDQYIYQQDMCLIKQ